MEDEKEGLCTRYSYPTTAGSTEVTITGIRRAVRWFAQKGLDRRIMRILCKRVWSGFL